MTTSEPGWAPAQGTEESHEGSSAPEATETTSESAAATPKPVPRPGPPRPGPRPGPTHAAVHPTHAVPSSDPHRFGRVDPDGTVWLISSAGERTIGSWQAGDTEAAFAHFGRRFDDLDTEVALMESRLTSGTGDARKIKSAAAALAESLPTASVLGDVDALAARLTTIVEHADSAAAADKAKREEHRAAQTARKETLAAEAEELANNATQWKAAGDRLREILEEWRTISGLDRKTDDALWKRYSAAREAFNRRRGSHFADLDRERAGARQAKEALCERAEALSDSTDWGPTAGDVPRPAGGVEGRGPRQQGRRRHALAAVQGRPGHLLHRAQRSVRRTRRRVQGERGREGGAAGGGREDRHIGPGRRTRRAAHHRRQVGQDRQGAARARRRSGATAAGDREEGARRAERTVSIPRLRPVPTNSASAQSNTSGRRRRPPRRGAPRMPNRRGPAPSSGGSGRKPPPRRSARRARPSQVRRRRRRGRRSSRAALWSDAWPRPCDAPPRRPAAARCAPTPPSPSCTSARSR